ncbi:MAG: hypothetical protein JKY70_11965 [Mucilaginibacter sp.]|nr:hypothetical protein [Mucilaginibacter sp.]
MKLLENENILTTADDNTVVLTNYRVRSVASKAWGHSQTTSIMLEKISSVQLVYLSFPVLLVLSGITGLVAIGLMSNSGESPLIFVIATILFIAGYFGSRRHVCSIASDGGAKIIFTIKGINKEQVQGFVENVELAKHNKMKMPVGY